MTSILAAQSSLPFRRAIDDQLQGLTTEEQYFTVYTGVHGVPSGRARIEEPDCGLTARLFFRHALRMPPRPIQCPRPFGQSFSLRGTPFVRLSTCLWVFWQNSRLSLALSRAPLTNIENNNVGGKHSLTRRLPSGGLEALHFGCAKSRRFRPLAFPLMLPLW